MSKCICTPCPNEALSTAAVCDFHLDNPSNVMPTNNTEDSELESQLRAIIKAPMRSQISTADIAVGMMSSTGLSEKIHNLKALITQREQKARLDEQRYDYEFIAYMAAKDGGKWIELRKSKDKRKAELTAQLNQKEE